MILGGRARVVPNQHTNPKSNLEEVTSNDTVNLMVADPLKTAAMMEESLENPRTVDEDKEVNDLHKNFSDAIFLVDEGRINCMIDVANSHMLPNNLSNAMTLEVLGPSSIKPKTTLTRINRMDFGLGGLAKAIAIPRLHKCELWDGEIMQHEE
nr:hypothetical protein CFP56_60574 [Quercus suber]